MRRFLGTTFLIVAVLQLGARGMQRTRTEVPLWDFASVYAAARTWVHGGNPYDVPSVVATWAHAGAFADRDVSYFATVYPPTSLVLLVPFAPLSTGVAMSLWLAITLALLIFQFIALAEMAGLKRGDPRLLLLIGATLFSAPAQFGLLAGQLSMPAISACIIAFWCVGRDREKLAGILLGLACAMKPQIAGPFVLYYLVLRRWSVSLSAILVGVVLCAVALIAMHATHIDWIHGWKDSIAATGRIGAVNDYGWTGEFRDEIVDLKMLIVSIVHNAVMLRLVIEGIVAALVVWYLAVFPRGAKRTNLDELIPLAALSAISLLPVYHRIYDVTLLTTALAWALAELNGPKRRYAIGLIVPMLIFLIPFDIVEPVGRRFPRFQQISSSAFWQTLIAPHYAWGLLGTTIVLLCTMRCVFNRSATKASGISRAA